MKLWLSPEADALDPLRDLDRLASRLHAAALNGAEFFALPVIDNGHALEWALACFHSPLILVPLPENLPDPIMRARLSQLPGKVVFPSDLPPGSQSVAPGPKRKGLDQTWAVVFTSGTSGSPKGVAISGSAFCASAHGHVVASGLAKATWLLNLPLYHVGGLSVLTRAFFLDSDICIGSSRFSSEESARWIRSGRVEGVSLVSTTLKRLLDLKDLSFSHLKIALLGGGPCPQSLSREALARGVPLRLTYGMTETASQIATERKQLSGLEPLEGVELQISYAGEILVKSPSLASGFFQNGVFVPLSLVDGFFATGDLGELHASRLQVFGRKSEQIITGGKKVSPLELDEALQELPGILDAAAVGLEDPEWGEVVCAAIIPDPLAAFSEETAKASLKMNLEGYKIPKRWVALPEIPRTASGKVERKKLETLVKDALEKKNTA